MTDYDSHIRKLTNEEIQTLILQGCSASDWNQISIDINCDLKNLENVRFSGFLEVHKGTILRNIPGGIGGCVVRENAFVENVASIIFEPEASHGVGTVVSVLDETGSRGVPIFPGLSSQIATLIAREPKWLQNQLQVSFNDFIEQKITLPEIGQNASVKNCGTIKNVNIGREVVIEGASRLENGSIINNAASGKSFTFVGSAVEATNFILEDGRLESKCIVTNCYIGQGCVIAKGFAAHDSLFFANCTMENGESDALLGGPYTVSMHKGTLLIGCQTSFLNAGSSTNQSNHMYKLGPVHWGILERGVKTSSGSHLMFGAKIGAFSLLMGSHKTHPDSSEFPFSYLFGDDRGSTIVVPAVMLRSCGLLRDEMKWPTRDRRLKRKLPLHDLITFDVLNPFTVETMLKANETIEELLTKPADDDLFIRYKGMKITRAALERAKSLYTLAIFKYLSKVLPELKFPEKNNEEPGNWVDLGGLIMPRSFLKKILETGNIPQAEKILKECYENYKKLELSWIASRFGEWWREREEEIMVNAKKFDDIIEEDRQDYLQMLSRETEMLAL